MDNSCPIRNFNGLTFKYTMKWQYWIVNMGVMKDGIMKVDKSGFNSQEIMH